MKLQLTRRSIPRALYGVVACAWVLALGTVMSFGQAAPQPAAARKTVNDGVYTAAQADRGQMVFQAQCAACHDVARFTGDEFLQSWTGRPLHALFELVSMTMPEDNPGSLKAQQYADVIAYLLKLNKFPVGQDELKGNAETMRAVAFAKRSP